MPAGSVHSTFAEPGCVGLKLCLLESCECWGSTTHIYIYICMYIYLNQFVCVTASTMMRASSCVQVQLLEYDPSDLENRILKVSMSST